MKKWTHALTTAAATTALIAVGTLAQAAASQTVEGGADFTVAYDCGTSPNSANFSFEGVEQNDVPCGGPRDEAIAVFKAPAATETTQTYIGTACLNLDDDLRAGLRFTGDQSDCEQFTVIVLGVTPPTDAPTTIAPTTTPTTLAVGAVPPAPTTTVAIELPATGPDRTDGGIVIALALLAIGGGLIVATRWRKDTTTTS